MIATADAQEQSQTLYARRTIACEQYPHPSSAGMLVNRPCDLRSFGTCRHESRPQGIAELRGIWSCGIRSGSGSACESRQLRERWVSRTLWILRQCAGRSAMSHQREHVGKLVRCWSYPIRDCSIVTRVWFP